MWRLRSKSCRVILPVWPGLGQLELHTQQALFVQDERLPLLVLTSTDVPPRLDQQMVSSQQPTCFFHAQRQIALQAGPVHLILYYIVLFYVMLYYVILCNIAVYSIIV